LSKDASATVAAPQDVELARRLWLHFSDKRRSRIHGMPFTVGFLQKWSGMGEHRAAAAINELRRRRILVPIDSYRSRRHGYRVTLYRLAQRLASVSLSVRRSASVNWWEHPLFGNPGGEKPVGVRRKDLTRWRSQRHRRWETFRRESWEWTNGISSKPVSIRGLPIVRDTRSRCS